VQLNLRRCAACTPLHRNIKVFLRQEEGHVLLRMGVCVAVGGVRVAGGVCGAGARGSNGTGGVRQTE
jgi:hypothetical protein